MNNDVNILTLYHNVYRFDVETGVWTGHVGSHPHIKYTAATFPGLLECFEAACEMIQAHNQQTNHWSIDNINAMVPTDAL